MMVKKGTIGVLTGGGDVPGLNPAIRAVTFRALREGYRVLGLRRGWAGLIELRRDRQADNSHCVIELTEDIVEDVSNLLICYPICQAKEYPDDGGTR